jgi:hypothetical protein
LADHKKQHIIPNCYLKSWCDPCTPVGQTPYIWRISRDGSSKKRKAPEKSFTETDWYTIKLPNGERDLTIEKTLGGIENEFIQILPRIRRREKLNIVHKAKLCVFVAAMHTRSKAQGEHFKQFHQRLHDQVVALEKKHNSSPTTSLETAELVEQTFPNLVETGVKVMAPMLFQMAMTIMCCTDDVGFITSDTPCVWFNPEIHKLPPFYRSPALGQAEIEVTMPLTPHHAVLITHHHEYPAYSMLNAGAVDEMNRTTRFHCNEEFVSWKGVSKPYWFERGKEPEDRWENTPEGKAAIAEDEKRDRYIREWEQEQQAKAEAATE